MTVDVRSAAETIWLGAPAYGTDPWVQVGDRWFATGRWTLPGMVEEPEAAGVPIL